MKNCLKFSIFFFLAVFLLSGNAMAIRYDPSTLDPTANQLLGLEGFFSKIGSSINPYSDEKGSEVFSVTGPISSAWQMHYSYSGIAPIEFGLYNMATDSTNLSDMDTLTLFNGSTGGSSGDISVVFRWIWVYDGFFRKYGNRYRKLQCPLLDSISI